MTLNTNKGFEASQGASGPCPSLETKTESKRSFWEVIANPASMSLTAKAGLFVAVAVLWLVFDMLSKQFFDGFELGEFIGGPYLGLFTFSLVHNTGAAWGMFGDSTRALGVLSLIVCTVIVCYMVWSRKDVNLIQALGAALVVSGGIGNAIDRFLKAYVVDFIDLTFMDFPLFNVADIGVTCGFVILVIGFLAAEHYISSKDEAEDMQGEGR